MRKEQIKNLHSTKKKELEQKLRLAYQAGQDSITCTKVIHSGKIKPRYWCDDEPCQHRVEEQTSTAEDEAIKRIMEEE